MARQFGHNTSISVIISRWLMIIFITPILIEMLIFKADIDILMDNEKILEKYLFQFNFVSFLCLRRNNRDNLIISSAYF